MSANQPNSKGKKKQKSTFTDEEIRRKAYEIWLSRREKHSDNSDENWYAAIETLKFERSIPGRIKTITWTTLIEILNSFKRPDDRSYALDVVKTCISSFSLLATILAGISLYITYQNNNERLITDRFSKSVEQLGSVNSEIRLGGIYALERISKDSHKDYLTIMEILTTFVREHTKRRCLINKKSTQTFSSKTKTKPTLSVKSPISNENNTCPITPDVQAVMTVLGRRVQTNDSQANPINLQNVNLTEVDLTKGDLSGANLREVNLSRAKLRETKLNKTNMSKANFSYADMRKASLALAVLREVNLSDTDLSEAILGYAFLLKANLSRANLLRADLYGANLSGANLSGAIMTGADLSGADLSGADLSGAIMIGADLNGADLSGADLTGANLIQVKFLTLEQVKTAINWEKVKYDLNFRKQLGLPPEKAPVRNSN